MRAYPWLPTFAWAVVEIRMPTTMWNRIGNQMANASISTTNGSRASSAVAWSNAAGPWSDCAFVYRCSRRNRPTGTTPVSECSRLSV